MFSALSQHSMLCVEPTPAQALKAVKPFRQIGENVWVFLIEGVSSTFQIILQDGTDLRPSALAVGCSSDYIALNWITKRQFCPQ